MLEFQRRLLHCDLTHYFRPASNQVEECKSPFSISVSTLVCGLLCQEWHPIGLLSQSRVHVSDLRIGLQFLVYLHDSYFFGRLEAAVLSFSSCGLP